MVIDDHINLTGSNPLIGANDDRFGPRFPDMSEVYSRRLRDITEQAAEATGVPVAHGVYVAVHGPSYETPAEILAFRVLGADAVGMSTVPEAIAARHAGLEVLGISCITNMAAGVLPQPLEHDEVMATARRVRGSFIALLEAVIAPALSVPLAAAARRRETERARGRLLGVPRRRRARDRGRDHHHRLQHRERDLRPDICAERVAMFKALSEGHAASGASPSRPTREPTPPCGPCRQICGSSAAISRWCSRTCGG